jgi:quinol monooxygenase YgiN
MAELTVIARAKAKPGHEADLERAMRAVVGPSHDEQECLRYAFIDPLEIPQVL